MTSFIMIDDIKIIYIIYYDNKNCFDKAACVLNMNITMSSNQINVKYLFVCHGIT